jgi:pSer/pThr/pTyr-binding forkhead associated (FHA) protein
MKVTLVVARGSHEGKEIPVARSPFLIGRDPECHLRPASQMISRRHCALVIRDGQVFLRDFGSTNGTLVNGVRIEDEQELHAHDEIKLDRLALEVRIEVSAPSAQTVAGSAGPAGLESGDDEVVAALLLELQDGEPGSPAVSAEPGMDSTVLSVPDPEEPAKSNPPTAKKQADKVPGNGDTASVAKGLLAKYGRKHRSK